MNTGWRTPDCGPFGHSPGFAISGIDVSRPARARMIPGSTDRLQRLIRIRGSCRGDPDPSGSRSQGGP